MKIEIFIFALVLTLFAIIVGLVIFIEHNEKSPVNVTAEQPLPKTHFVKSPDQLDQWELIGETEHCRSYYRRHKQNRVYWSVCDDGSSSIAVK
jgi:cell division protein FtsN